MSRSLILLLGWGVCVSGAFAQSSGKQPVLAGAGYSFPVPLSVAPGQIITLFVESVDTQLTAPVRATGTPLPSSLGGVSVTYRQSSDRPALILEVKPGSTFFALPPSIGASAAIFVVTPQIPVPMFAVCARC